MFIAFMSSYLYGNCIQDVIFLLLALFLFLKEQAHLNPGISSSGLRRAKYRLKRTMQMFFINFSYFLAIGLPLISCAEYKGHIYNATISERRALRYFAYFPRTVCPRWDGEADLDLPPSPSAPLSLAPSAASWKTQSQGDVVMQVITQRHYTRLLCVFIFRALYITNYLKYQARTQP